MRWLSLDLPDWFYLFRSNDFSYHSLSLSYSQEVYQPIEFQFQPYQLSIFFSPCFLILLIIFLFSLSLLLLSFILLALLKLSFFSISYFFLIAITFYSYFLYCAPLSQNHLNFISFQSKIILDSLSLCFTHHLTKSVLCPTQHYPYFLSALPSSYIQ